MDHNRTNAKASNLLIALMVGASLVALMAVANAPGLDPKQYAAADQQRVQAQATAAVAAVRLPVDQAVAEEQGRQQIAVLQAETASKTAAAQAWGDVEQQQARNWLAIETAITEPLRMIAPLIAWTLALCAVVLCVVLAFTGSTLVASAGVRTLGRAKIAGRWLPVAANKYGFPLLVGNQQRINSETGEQVALTAQRNPQLELMEARRQLFLALAANEPGHVTVFPGSERE